MNASPRISIVLTVLALILCACGGSTPGGTQVVAEVPSKASAAPQQVVPPTPTLPTATSQPKPTATTAPTQTPVPTATSKPVEAGASRSKPLSLGTEFKGKDWAITVSDVIRGQDAAQAIAKANQFNTPPKQGFEYLIANVKLKNVSTKQEAQSASMAVDLHITGDKNIAYSRASVVPPKQLGGELFPNGAAEGQVVFEIPSDEKNLMFIVGELMSFDSKAMRFMAIDENARLVPDPALKAIKPTDLGKRRDTPAKIGDKLITGAWEFTIEEAIRGDKAAELAKKANQFNKPAQDDQEYVAVKVKARYLGGNEPDRGENINGGYLKITGEKNTVYESPSVVPPEPVLDATLFAGGQTEGWRVLSAGKDEKGLLVIFQPLLSFARDEARYIALE